MKKYFKSFSLDVDCGFEERPSPSGPNNIMGGDNTLPKTAVASYALYLGDDDGTIGEVVDDTSGVDLDDLQGDSLAIGTVVTTQDISLQVGTELGAIFWCRIKTC